MRPTGSRLQVLTDFLVHSWPKAFATHRAGGLHKYISVCDTAEHKIIHFQSKEAPNDPKDGIRVNDASARGRSTTASRCSATNGAALGTPRQCWASDLLYLDTYLPRLSDTYLSILYLGRYLPDLY